jgi:hypothetical protein
MKLTIIKDDNAVYLNGSSFGVDCSSLGSGVHAVQWSGESGWIEYKSDELGVKPENEPIYSLQDFQSFVDAAEAAQVAAEQEAEAVPVPPQPEAGWIYNPVTNTWEAP